MINTKLTVVLDYIAYEQETQRNPSVSADGKTIEAVSSNLDDQTMHELYLWPFQNAIRAGVASLMCSYNRINGSYACQNSKTLNGILKEELGFQGYVRPHAVRFVASYAKPFLRS